MKARKYQTVLLFLLLIFCMHGTVYSGGFIAGHVTDEYGNSISVAAVMAWRGGALRGSGISGGEDGRYDIESLHAGTYELRVQAEGYEYRIESDIVVVDTQLTWKSFSLSIEGIISGKVTLPDGTTGVSDVIISAVPTSGSGPTLFAYSDSSGNYSIKNLPAGTYDVKAYKSDNLFETVEQETVTAGNTTSNVNFSETAWGTIAGTVTNGTTGLEGVMVHAFNPNDFTVSNCDETDSNGDYSIRFLPVGTYTVRAVLNDYMFEDITGNSVTAGQTTSDVDLTGTASAGKIAGKVTESDGTTAISDAVIIAFDTSENPVIADKTDANGDYELKELPTGMYKVAVSVGNNKIVADDVSVTTGSTTTLNLFSVDGAISGTVEDSSQNPIENAQVLIANDGDVHTTSTDSNGDYIITGLAAGTYDVEVLSINDYIGNTIEDVTVQANTETMNQDFTLSTGGTISGTVSSSAGAIAGVFVAAILESGPNYTAGDVTDENGNYSVGGLPTGTYTLVVQAEGYVSGSEADVSVTAGQDSSGLDFTLGTSGGTISGTVYESNGTTPIENVWVSCYCENKSVMSVTTDSNGDYSLALLQAGTYEVLVLAVGYVHDSIEDVVVTGTQENSGNDFSLETEE